MARPGLLRNRKFARLATALETLCGCGGELAAMGSLELLWAVAYENGDERIGDTLDVENAARWRGQPGMLTRALYEAGGETSGFIEETPGQPGRYQIHDFWTHAPDYVRRRREREDARVQKGESLSEARARAGKRGAAARHGLASDLLLPGIELEPKANTHAELLTTDLSGDEQLSGKRLANVLTPAPAPAPAPSSSPRKENFPASGEAGQLAPAKTARKRSKKPDHEPLPFRADAALALIASTAGDRFLPTNPGGGAIAIERVIRTYSDRGTWELVGAFLAAGGEQFAGILDSRWVTLRNFAAAVARAKAWDASGRGSLARGRNGRATPTAVVKNTTASPLASPDPLPPEDFGGR